MNNKHILSLVLSLIPLSSQAATDAYKAVEGHEACMGHGYTKSGIFTRCLPETPKEGCDSGVFSKLSELSGEDKIPSCESLLRDPPLMANPALKDDRPLVLEILKKKEKEGLMGS